METYVLARILHILAIILWIGGVAMVTTVILPTIRKLKTKEEQLKFFEQIERRFSRQAKIATVVTGITGFYMLYLLDGWERYLDIRYWWIHAMTLVWLIFTVVLFILEPLVLHKLFKKHFEKDPVKTFAAAQRMHWILLILSTITIIGAVAGSHGWFFIQ